MFLIILILEIINITSCVHEAQLGPALCDPMDCSLPGSFVHGISQARTLEWVAISFSRGSSWPRYRTHISCVSCIAGRFFTTWVTGELISYICQLFELVCSCNTVTHTNTDNNESVFMGQNFFNEIYCC